MNSLLSDHPQIKAIRTAEEAEKKRTATHSFNWWNSLTREQRLNVLVFANSSRMPEALREENRPDRGRETEQVPFSRHHRVEVRPIVGLEFSGPVDSYTNSLASYQFPIGRLFRVRDAGSNAPQVCLLAFDSPGARLVVVPGPMKEDGERMSAALLNAHADPPNECGRYHLAYAGDEHIVGKLTVCHVDVLVPVETAKLIGSFFGAVEPAAWHYPPTGPTPMELAEQIWQAGAEADKIED